MKLVALVVEVVFFSCMAEKQRGMPTFFFFFLVPTHAELRLLALSVSAAIRIVLFDPKIYIKKILDFFMGHT